jgi:hypothetical protein
MGSKTLLEDAAIQDVIDPTPTNFLRFGNLPTELQSKIWKCAAFNAMQIRILEVSIGPYSNIRVEPGSKPIVDHCKYVCMHADLKELEGYQAYRGSPSTHNKV